MGYIVSCRFHHAADHNGILFLLQSPGCDAAALYTHLQDFLANMSLTLATLSSVALAALKVSLTQALAQ
ncbi:hypothetical protein [Candidatus Sodalis endolongispinus]|uniref:hypothetical protein n=1 Tax=Candidatus Sodalis endolongispinus TaxID=2812662 RepID=UPI0035E3FC34